MAIRNAGRPAGRETGVAGKGLPNAQQQGSAGIVCISTGQHHEIQEKTTALLQNIRPQVPDPASTWPEIHRDGKKSGG